MENISTEKLITMDSHTLSVWTETHSETKLSYEEATLLCDYMEGHDYQLCINQNNEVFKKDLQSDEVFKYTIDELVDVVAEWNYELILSTKEEMDDVNLSPVERIKLNSKFLQHKLDEKMIDEIFEKTPTGKNLSVVAENIKNDRLNMQNIRKSR